MTFMPDSSPLSRFADLSCTYLSKSLVIELYPWSLYLSYLCPPLQCIFRYPHSRYRASCHQTDYAVFVSVTDSYKRLPLRLHIIADTIQDLSREQRVHVTPQHAVCAQAPHPCIPCDRLHHSHFKELLREGTCVFLCFCLNQSAIVCVSAKCKGLKRSVLVLFPCVASYVFL